MTLAVPPPVSPLQQQVARVFRRAMSSLDIPDGEVPEVAAGVVVALPGIARAFDGLAALEEIACRLAAMNARHSPVRWAEDSDVIVCACGQGAYPCPDRRLLDGETPEPAPDPAWQRNVYAVRREAASMVPVGPEMTGFLG